jgi:hypothetical protein
MGNGVSHFLVPAGKKAGTRQRNKQFPSRHEKHELFPETLKDIYYAEGKSRPHCVKWKAADSEE